MKAPSWVQMLRVVCVLIGAPAAAAEMLDEAACTQLKGEQARLSAAGVQTEMLYGPDWAKANLPSSRLDEIKRLMEVEEQLSFRCPRPAPPQPVEPVAAAGEDGAVAAPKPPRKKKAAKKAEDAAADTQAAGPAEPAPKPEKPKQQQAKPKRKPVANDAYVPPLDPGGAISSTPGEPTPQPPPQGPPSKALSP